MSLKALKASSVCFRKSLIGVGKSRIQALKAKRAPNLTNKFIQFLFVPSSFAGKMVYRALQLLVDFFGTWYV